MRNLKHRLNKGRCCTLVLLFARKTASLILIVSSLPTLVFAESVVPTQGANNLSVKIAVMEEVVVTATRNSKIRLVNPYSVDVVTADDIALSTNDQLADLIGRLPGILITDAGQAGQKRIRIRGEEARRVALLIDNQEFLDHREVGVPLLVNTSRIQRIEVVRSPASVLYGPRAMGGVINIITQREATRPIEFDLRTTYNGATNGLVIGAQLAGNKAIGDHASFSWDVGGSDNKQRLRETPVGQIERTAYENSGFNSSVAYATGNHTIGLGYETFKSASEVYVEPVVRFTPPFLDFVIDAPQRDREKVRVDYHYDPASEVFQSLKFDAYRQLSDREFNTFPSMSLAPGLNLDTSIISVSQLESDGMNLQTDWLLTESVSVISGLQWVDDEVNQNRLRDVETNGVLTESGSQLDEARLGSLAWYLQLEYDIGNFSFLPGMRTYKVDGEMQVSNHFANLSSFSDDHTVGSLAVVYAPTEASALRASYSEGYIYPSLFNLVIGAFAGATFVNPDPNLLPETSETLELGYRYQASAWSIDAVLFQTNANNYIDAMRCLPTDGCIGARDEVYKNIGESRSHGVEMSLDYQSDNFAFRSNITWLKRRKDYDGVETWDSGVPQLSGSISAEYASMIKDMPVAALLVTRFESESNELVATRRGAKLETNPGYGVVDIELRLQPFESVSMTFVGANLADRTYHSANENLWAPGRHLRVGFSLAL